MKTIYFIRHGKTKGNQEKRYIGKTDESLSELGIREILQKKDAGIYLEPEFVAISPMKRCVETAKLIYPNHTYLLIDQLKECDFGDFEEKNYLELKNHADYQLWIESNGSMAFPNGEDLEGFKARCISGFIELMHELEKKAEVTIALVIHGGTIMAIMSELCNEEKSYFQWMTDNGNGYICQWNGKRLEFVSDCH